MEKIKELNRYQKGILILLVVMAVIFGILYAKATSKIGFLYMDKIFEVSQENGNTVQIYRSLKDGRVIGTVVLYGQGRFYHEGKFYTFDGYREISLLYLHFYASENE